MLLLVFLILLLLVPGWLLLLLLLLLNFAAVECDRSSGLQSLAQQDPELYGMICEESARQHNCLELIASENFTSRAVIECLGSCLTNKYAEGLPGARYYGGNEVVDKVLGVCEGIGARPAARTHALLQNVNRRCICLAVFLLDLFTYSSGGTS